MINIKKLKILSVFASPPPSPSHRLFFLFFLDGYGFPTVDGKHKNVCMCRNERLPLEVLMPKINTRLPHGLVEECLHHGKPLCMNFPLLSRPSLCLHQQPNPCSSGGGGTHFPTCSLQPWQVSRLNNLASKLVSH